MRIIFDNLTDTATIQTIVGTEVLPASNLGTRERELIWRTALGTTTATLAVWLDGDGTDQRAVQAIVLYRTNFDAGTIRVRLWDGPAKATLVYDSGSTALVATLAFGDLLWGIDPLGKSMYTDWGFSNTRLWLANPVYGNYMEIEIVGTTDENYLQASRLFIGSYWEPAHAPKAGMQIQWVDTSKPQRTEGGTVHTEPGIQYRRLMVEGEYMDESERSQTVDILRKRGLREDLFVSVFPGNGGAYERDHELQAVLGSIEPMTLPLYGMANYAFTFEET